MPQLHSRCIRLFAILISLVVISAWSVPNALADPASPIDIVNVDTPDPVASGSQILYSITMTNTGGARIDNVVFADQLNGVGGIGVPPQLQITSSRGSCSQTTTLVTCNGGTIEGRGTWFVTIRGVVTAANDTVINNTVSVSGTKSAQNFTTTNTITTLVVGGGGSPKPDLTISKNGPTSVTVSSPMTYTLTVNNIGTANAPNVKVIDTVPAGLTAITASGTSLFVCGVVGQTVTCTGGAVNQGSNATITINATSPAVTSTITNTAVVDPDDAISEGNELNNTSALVNTQVTTGAPPPSLTIDVTDDLSVLAGAGPDPVVPGGVLTYKILVTNISSQRADDVVIVNGTQGLVASSVIVNQIVTNGSIGTFGGCIVTASEAKCSIKSLNGGGTILMTVTGSVIASAGSTIINTGTVTGNIKNTGLTSQDTELTTVRPSIDLTITKSDSPDPVCAASWPGVVPVPLLGPPVCLGGLTYTYVIGNSGINIANGVTIRDPLPAGTFLDSFSAPGFSGGCSVDGSNVLTCTGGTVGPPPSTPLTTVTVVLVAPPGTGTIQNTVTVDPNNAIFEADETNNTATATTVVATGIDLTILKVDSTPGFDPIATSGTQTYTITVDNIGTQNATNIRVRDILPAGTRFRSAQGDHGFTCQYSAANNTVDCSGGSILGTAAEFYPPFGAPGDDRATIVIRVFAQPIIGLMHNEARVDPFNTIVEVNEANNIEFEDTDVGNGGAMQGAFNQFTILKTQISPGNPVARNAKVTYTIAVTNDGTDPAVGVKVRDFLPAGSTYIEATGSNHFECSQIGGHIDCSNGEIVAAATATITVTMFAPDTPGTYTNQAVVDPDNTIPEGNEFDNASSVQTVVTNGGNGPFYELSIVKTQDSPANNVARNAVVTYLIQFTNSGSDPVIGVRVRDVFPAGSRFIEAVDVSGTNQFLCVPNGNTSVDCSGGQLAAGGSATVRVKIFAPDTPGTYTNQALVDPDNTVPEGDEENNRFSLETIVENGGNGAFNDLTILKTGTANTTPGGSIEYSLRVSNNGSNAASGVSVRDVLPAAATFVSAADAGTGPGAPFTCAHSGGVVNCTGATINSGGVGNARFINITVTAPQAVTVPPSAGLHNTATVDPDNTVPEGDEFNNTSSCDTTVTSAINLTITKSGPTVASQSDVTDYTITVTNNVASGMGQLATGVVMVDPLPVGLIPLAVDAGTGNNWNCQISQNPINLVQCIGDLGPDSGNNSVTIKITVFITAESGRSLDNVACVDPADTITESNELDNCSEFGTFVAPAPPQFPDLLVSKQVDSLSTTPGANLEYTVSISNVGMAKAKGWNAMTMTGLTLTDSLPDQVTFTNYTATNGWSCTFVMGTLTCHDDGSGMESGANAQITILATVKNNAAVPIANTASADPALADLMACMDCVNEPFANQPNNTSTVTSSIGSSGFDLVLSTITDVPDPVSPGQGLKYTIVAVNGGTATANSAVVRIMIPSAGVTFMGADGSNGFNCGAVMGTTLECTGNLPGGGNTTITVNFITNIAGLPPDVTLTATIDPDNAFAETNEGNNTKMQTTTISTGGTCSACVDLVAAALIATPEPIPSGSSVTIKFQVVNIGDTPTDLDVMSENLASILVSAGTGGTVGSAMVSTSTPAVTCMAATLDPFASVSCKGNLAPAQGVTITLTLSSITSPTGGLQIFGFSDPGGNQMEFLETNNNATQTVVVTP